LINQGAVLALPRVPGTSGKVRRNGSTHGAVAALK
jgi:hypothetical protein